jgi:hypothetical protein
MADMAKEAHQAALTNKLQAQVKDYQSKFGALLGAGQ